MPAIVQLQRRVLSRLKPQAQPLLSNSQKRVGRDHPRRQAKVAVGSPLKGEPVVAPTVKVRTALQQHRHRHGHSSNSDAQGRHDLVSSFGAGPIARVDLPDVEVPAHLQSNVLDVGGGCLTRFEDARHDERQPVDRMPQVDPVRDVVASDRDPFASVELGHLGRGSIR